MKKLYAFILFIPLFALFAETIKAPTNCNKAVSKMDCPMMSKMKGKCMMAMMMKHKGEKKKNKCNSGSCFDCPLFNVTMFKSSFGFEFLRATSKIEYAVMPGNNLSDYYFQNWKPPDPISLSV